MKFSLFLIFSFAFVLLSVISGISALERKKLRIHSHNHRLSKKLVDNSKIKLGETVKCKEICEFFCENYEPSETKGTQVSIRFNYDNYEKGTHNNLRCICTEKFDHFDKYSKIKRSLLNAPVVEDPTIGWMKCKKVGNLMEYYKKEHS